MIIVDKNGNLQNSDDFPQKLREHCMFYVRRWKNSRVFIEQMEAQFAERFAESTKK